MQTTLVLRRTRPYQELFRGLYPQIDPRHIEALMRNEYGTLDHLGPETIICEARIAVVLIAVAPELVERLALSYGL